MRQSLKYIAIIVFVATFFSCKKDNYDPPSLTLSGSITYQGAPINVERNAVHLQIYQYGFGRVGAIDETFAQDGSYSTLLFGGDYKVIIPNGDGPFRVTQKTPGVPDSVAVSMNGNQTVNFEVTPYYLVGNPQITAVGTDSVHAGFQIQKIITDANAKDVEYAALYINKTQFVAGSTNIAAANIAGSAIADMNNVSLGVKVPSITPTQNYVYARIGIKIANVEDLIFSPLVKVDL